MYSTERVQSCGSPAEPGESGPEGEGSEEQREGQAGSCPAHQTGLEKKVERQESSVKAPAGSPVLAGAAISPQGVSPLSPPLCTLVPESCEGLSSGQQDGVFT